MMDSPENKFVQLLPAISVMVLIFMHSAMPADVSKVESGWIVNVISQLLPFHMTMDTLTFLTRKMAHFTEFLLLGLSLQWGMNRGIRTFLFGTVYAIFDEIHQSFVPGRSCEFRDICIDVAGVLFGILLIFIFCRLNRGDCNRD